MNEVFQPVAPCETYWSLGDISRALGVSTQILNQWCNSGVFREVVVMPGGKGERRIADSVFKEFLEAQTIRFERRAAHKK